MNRMIGEKRLKEGNKPGVTRGLSWVRLTPYLELMDSPGMLWPKIEDEKAGAAIALLGSVRQEILDEEQLAFYLVDMLKKAAPTLLMERYDLDEIAQDSWDVLGQICMAARIPCAGRGIGLRARRQGAAGGIQKREAGPFFPAKACWAIAACKKGPLGAREAKMEFDFYRLERQHARKGQRVAGADEAGRGPLAGPVVAAACILPADCFLEGVNDSKKLTAKKRDMLYEQIMQRAISYGIGIVEVQEIQSSAACSAPCLPAGNRPALPAFCALYRLYHRSFTAF